MKEIFEDLNDIVNRLESSTKFYRIHRGADSEEISLEVESVDANIAEIFELADTIKSLVNSVKASIEFINECECECGGGRKNVEEILSEDADSFLREHAAGQEKGWKVICDVGDSVSYVAGKCVIGDKEFNYMPLKELVFSAIKHGKNHYAFTKTSLVAEKLVAIEDPVGKRYYIKGRI